MRVLERHKPTLASVSANDYAGEALRLMKKLGQRWIFVLDRTEIAGLVFAKDLENEPQERLHEGDVREYMIPTPCRKEAQSENTSPWQGYTQAYMAIGADEAIETLSDGLKTRCLVGL